MPYLVKEAVETSTGKSTRITLEHPHPDGTFPTWRIFYNHKQNPQPAPTAGMTIQCTPVANTAPNGDTFYWIKSWHPVEANAGPQQVGAAVQQHVNGIARPNGAARPARTNSQACEILVTGTIGRFLANQKNWPTQGELTGMVTNARDSFENGMNAVPEDEKPSGHAANNEEPDWLNQ